MQSRSSNNLKGIDVSHYQGDIDYTKVKAEGIKIVYIKATEGVDIVDSKLQENYKGAKAAGLKVGFYHFFIARNEINAKQQAQFFVDNLKSLDNDCKYALDLEVDQNLDKSALSNLAKVFLEEVRQLTDEDVVIYTYTNFARNNVSNILKDYPLWIAHYGVDTPGVNPVWDSWIGFQYSSSGKVNGISGNVDLDVFTPDIFIAKDSTTPVTKPSPKPNTSADNNILKLQKKLNRLKISDAKGDVLLEDGIKGPKTIEAIKKLQSILGFTSNGVENLQLISVMNQIFSKPLIQRKAKGTIVRYIQFRVGAAIDGLFGTETELKLKTWQRNNNITSDGIVGLKTWSKLIG